MFRNFKTLYDMVTIAAARRLLFSGQVLAAFINRIGALKDYSDFECMVKQQGIEYLIQGMTCGKEEAWSYFLKKYGGLIFSCINNILNTQAGRDIKEDCFQEILKALIEDGYRRLKLIRSFTKESFNCWLRTVAKRRALNFSQGMKKGLSNLPDEILHLIPDNSSPPDKETLRRKIHSIIREQLPDKEQMIMLYYIDGLTLEEISKHLGLKIGNVFNIKEKAISILRNFLI